MANAGFMGCFNQIAMVLILLSGCSESNDSAVKHPRSQRENDFIEAMTYHGPTATIDEFIKDGQVDKRIATNMVGVEGDIYWTPLCFASSLGNKEAVQQLLAAGADIKYKDQNGMTPLLLAANAGTIEAIDVLLKNGADIEEKDSNNSTALIQAATAGNVNTVKFLVGKGCKLAQNNGALNALDFAIFYQQRKVIIFLESTGLKRTNLPADVPESYIRGE